MTNLKQDIKTMGVILAGIVLTGCTKRHMSDYVVVSNSDNKMVYRQRTNPEKQYVLKYDNPCQIYYYSHIRPGDIIAGDTNVLNHPTNAEQRMLLEVRCINGFPLHEFRNRYKNERQR